MENTITALQVKRPLMNRLSYWLYNKFCKEPYIPEGKIYVTVRLPKPNSLNDKKAMVKITFQPKYFIPGVHEWHIHDKLYKGGDEISFI